MFFRDETSDKDKLHNKVLELLTSMKCGFQAAQVDTLGKKVVSTITTVLWYLDPHQEKLAARGITMPDALAGCSGFYQWQKQHKKKPMVHV